MWCHLATGATAHEARVPTMCLSEYFNQSRRFTVATYRQQDALITPVHFLVQPRLIQQMSALPIFYLNHPEVTVKLALFGD